jgi:hypothetical protein
MSRRESDREDLLREATALVERAELQIPDENEPIVVGFRSGGSASFFFGADPVYQFNAAREFRRGYIDGLLYKAEHRQIICLRRERGALEVALLRTELKTEEAQSLLRQAHHRLMELEKALSRGSFAVIGQVPAQSDVISRIKNWLAEMSPQIKIAQAANAR